MSQRGPAAHSASNPPATAPVKHEHISPHTRPAQLSNHDVQSDKDRAVGHGHPPGSKAHSKTLGMYSILNPTEPHVDARESVGQPRQWQNSEQPARAHASVPPSQQEISSVSLPGTPGGGNMATPLGRPALSERNSPAAYPFPATNAQKPLSPNSTHGNIVHEEPRLSHPPHSAAGTKRPFSYAGDGSLELKPPPYSHHHPSNSLPNAATMVSPSRAYAQPARHMESRHGAPGPQQTGDHQRYTEAPRPHPHQYHQGLHAPQPHAGRPHSGPHPIATTEGGPPWPDMMRRPVLGGTVTTSDGQQAFMTLPGSEIPIPVQVDYSQASKKADEKRQRNAKASTRHRRKKKNIQEENVRLLQDLKDEQDSMADQIESLTRQRDFYREERNRLRDIVLRTPAISQHASGPPSPISTRSVNSYQDHSPVGGQPRPLHTPSQGYLSESSSVERPAQRRRTDDRPEYSANYSTQPGPPPAALPPMYGNAQAMPPRPMTAHPTAHQERLPPLSSIDGTPAPQEMYAGHPAQAGHAGQGTHERDAVVRDWRMTQPRPYETGWATPRNAEGHQR